MDYSTPFSPDFLISYSSNLVTPPTLSETLFYEFTRSLYFRFTFVIIIRRGAHDREEYFLAKFEFPRALRKWIEQILSNTPIPESLGSWFGDSRFVHSEQHVLWRSHRANSVFILLRIPGGNQSCRCHTFRYRKKNEKGNLPIVPVWKKNL